MRKNKFFAIVCSETLMKEFKEAARTLYGYRKAPIRTALEEALIGWLEKKGFYNINNIKKR